MSRIGDWFRRPSIAARLDLLVQQNQQINVSISQINQRLGRMETRMATLDTLATDLSQNTSAVQSAVTLLGTLAQEIRDLKTPTTDPATAAKIDALDAQLTANTKLLADAVAANTPAAEPPAPAATGDTGTGTAGSDTSAGTGAGGTAPATGGDANPPAEAGGDNPDVA